jgi:hypothetical protein
MNTFKTALMSACFLFAAGSATAADDAMKKAEPMAKDAMMKKEMTAQECKDHMAKNDGMKKDDAMAKKDDAMMKKDDAGMKKDEMCAEMMKKDGAMMKKDEMAKDAMKK